MNDKEGLIKGCRYHQSSARGGCVVIAGPGGGDNRVPPDRLLRLVSSGFLLL